MNLVIALRVVITYTLSSVSLLHAEDVGAAKAQVLALGQLTTPPPMKSASDHPSDDGLKAWLTNHY